MRSVCQCGFTVNNSKPFSNSQICANFAPGLTAERWVAYLKTELKIVYSKTQPGLIFNLMIADAPKISQASIAYAGLEDILLFCQAKLGHTKLFDDPLLPHERTFWIKK